MFNPRHTLAAALIAALAVAASAVADEHADNLLDNGSFETLRNGQPSGWLSGAQPADSAHVSISTDKKKEGQRSLRVKSKAGCEWAASISNKIALEKGKTYTLTGFAQVAKGMAIIKFDYFNGNQHVNQTIGTVLQATADQWQQSRVQSETHLYPQATHIVATVAVLGEADACFDQIVMTAK